MLKEAAAVPALSGIAVDVAQPPAVRVQSIRALGAIGAYDDERTGLRGVNRLALTDADAAGRRHVVGLMKALGL